MAKRNGGLTVGGSGDYGVSYDRWVFGVFVEAGPRTLNMVSSGLVPRGKEVAIPEVLRHLPKRPPGR